MTKGRSAKVTLSRKVLYELDGGDREKKKTFQRRRPAECRHRLRPDVEGRVTEYARRPQALVRLLDREVP